MKEKINTVYRTDNYSMFKRLDGNRDVLEARARRLVKSIQENGYIQNPILVNEKYEVVDGQGRLEALERLGLPVDYIVVPGIGVSECVVMNQSLTNWALKDYIKSYAERGNESYLYFNALLKRYENTGLDFDTINNAITGTATSSGRIIREGKFSCTEKQYEEAIKTLDYAVTCRPFLRYAGGRPGKYLAAINFCYHHPEIDNDLLRKRLEQHQVELVGVSSVPDAMRILEDVYNSRTRKKVYISADYKRMKDERGK